MEQNFPTSGENELIQLLLKRQAELNSLLEVTQAINKNTAASVLFEMLEVVLKVHLKVGTMRLLIRDGDRFYCASKFGGVFESPKALQQICRLVQGNKAITQLKTHPKKVLNVYDYFVPVFHKDEILAFGLLGDFDTRPELISNDLNFIETLINVIIVALENKKLFKERVDRERLQRDIELASEVQNMLFPQSLPKTGFVEVGATYLPSQNIGGDYFDFIHLNKDEFLWCIADVSGKGVSAALLMANLQAGLRAWATVEDDLTKVVKQLNKIVFSNTKGERFITMFVGRYNKQNRKLQFVNAGHNAPILINGNTHAFLNQGSTIIGVFEELPFVNLGIETLGKGSLIFNYTDGLVESSEEDIYIDESELADFLVLNSNLHVDELNSRILANIKTTYNARMDSDDVTLFSIKIL